MGDPNQLQPTVLEQSCKKHGFGESWLGRVYKLDKSKVHLLDTQYRMDPVILQFPNKRFYESRVMSGENVQNREPQVFAPFLFFDTQGRGREESDKTFSFRNSYEIAVIKDLLKQDPDIVAIIEAHLDARIIIITPYKSQAKHLREMCGPLKMNIEVSTVDAFQGQEGDIVILSTVRTKQVGFVDDKQRLNVALTRAKRVLRVVGDKAFFEGLPNGSTLRALAVYASKAEFTVKTKIQRIAASPPDLSIHTTWKITLTQRFHGEMALLSQSHKNISLNTLFSLALPDLNACGSRVTEKEGWHVSWLKGYSKDLRVIWIVRDYDGVGIIEAHHAGTPESCLRFRQKNHTVPYGSRSPRADMLGVVSKDVPSNEKGKMFSSWLLDSHLQDAILFGKLDDFPLSKIQLDPPQERVARSPPPLLIESRSGTGKTLVNNQMSSIVF